MGAILPGSTIGIFGGGQLGRMTAMAARSLGYHVHALDPDESCAARFVVERCITAPFDDEFAAADLARRSNVVTLEIEKVALPSLERAATYAPMRPSPDVLRIIQNRGDQKTWLARRGFPVGSFRVARSAEEVAQAVQAIGPRTFVKACTGGYDGQGQIELDGSADAAAAYVTLGSRPVVVERALPIEAELSVLVVRRPSGEVVVYPPALNHHEARILAWSVLPAPMDPKLAERAQEMARAIAEALTVEGLLVVELFLVNGDLLVNELAPRPHNSFHSTEVACETSQFEQLVRAVCDLPLGSARVMRSVAIANLLGDSFLATPSPRFDEALALPGVRLHLYGKRVARPGRKMGHLSAAGATSEEAVKLVQEAYRRLHAGQVP
jgi:5-(carboxyamino)imidazole ribonucleotide synthase